MAVYVDIYWFDNSGNVSSNISLKVTDIYSRNKLENNVKNYRFDDLYMNEEIRKKIITYIEKDIRHLSYTAVVIDDILLEPIFIKPEGKNYEQDSYELL